MNLTFFDQAYWWDVLFAAILLFCTWGAAKRGAFQAVSGIAGTLLGIILGNHFQGGLAVFIEPALRPMMESLAQKADLTRVTGGKNVTTIGENAFYGCSALENAGSAAAIIITTESLVADIPAPAAPARPVAPAAAPRPGHRLRRI